MCSVMVVSILFPRFPLMAALGDRRELLSGPVALAPEAGRQQVVGEVSAAAEAHGVMAGMRVDEALARCPDIRLVPPDPDGVRGLWREILERLGRVGAAGGSHRGGGGHFQGDGGPGGPRGGPQGGR